MSQKYNIAYVRVAQLDRASGYGPEGRGFESCHARCEVPELFQGLIYNRRFFRNSDKKRHYAMRLLFAKTWLHLCRRLCAANHKRQLIKKNNYILKHRSVYF